MLNAPAWDRIAVFSDCSAIVSGRSHTRFSYACHSREAAFETPQFFLHGWNASHARRCWCCRFQGKYPTGSSDRVDGGVSRAFAILCIPVSFAPLMVFLPLLIQRADRRVICLPPGMALLERSGICPDGLQQTSSRYFCRRPAGLPSFPRGLVAGYSGHSLSRSQSQRQRDISEPLFRFPSAFRTLTFGSMRRRTPRSAPKPASKPMKGHRRLLAENQPRKEFAAG